MTKGQSLSEAIDNGYGVWMVEGRSELVSLQRKLSATASRKGVKIKSRSFVSIDEREDRPTVMYTVQTEVI